MKNSNPDVTPVRVGMLIDYIFPPPSRYDTRRDFEDGLRLALDELIEAGQIDRPVEILSRDVQGLPNGDFRSVVRAFHELVEEGCVVIYGPLVSENAVPLREHVEALAQVPVVSTMGSEDFLGPWTFALNNGSLAEEPGVIASVIRHDGHRRIAVAHEKSLIGVQYLDYFRQACDDLDLEIVREVGIAQVEADKTSSMRLLRDSKPDAVMHVGFGHGLWGMNDALAELGWDPPRYTTTAFELAYFNDDWMKQLASFVGLDQYDERNTLGQAVLDRFAKRFGRRPEYYAPCFAYDIGRVVAHGIAGASPLTGLGVRHAIERIKHLPAAAGAPGTRIRFGKFIRQG
jgi:Periplasmic binding protein